MSKPETIDVTDQDFGTVVLEGSRQRPVVVDFWAPWCGPCRALGPVLERLHAQGAGSWLLVKLNVDDNPAAARRYGIQGIPAVKAFRDGDVVSEFVGAQPESSVRRWLEEILPSPADDARVGADALRAKGDLAGARALLEKALSERPTSGPLLLGLARVELEQGQPQAALDRLDRIPETVREKLVAELLPLRWRCLAALAGDEASLQARADEQARMGLAWHRAAANPREALELLLGVFSRQRRTPDGDAARKAMLEIFEYVGQRSELAEEFRDRLARELYR